MGGLFDIDSNKQQIKDLEEEISNPDIWNNIDKANEINKKLSSLKKIVDGYQNIYDNLVYYLELLEISSDNELREISQNLIELEKEVKDLEINTLLNKEYDKDNCYLEIHPGAGGTESQDWGSMLLRMYTRWASQHDFKVETVDYQPGDDAGIKSVTLMIEGKNAYGYLRSERGVHRLVRISPFDSAGRRHTSFASVNVMPELDDSVEVELRPEDIKMEVFRASGAGGQHINKTSSAVRLIHIPTGIVVSSQAQRSQFQNRATAENMLRAKLYQLEMEEKEKQRAAIQGEQLDIGWGSQIRSYVFHPYSMVKDHRTDYETGNIQAVMDGDLDPFINAYLQWKLQQANPQ